MKPGQPMPNYLIKSNDFAGSVHQTAGIMRTSQQMEANSGDYS